MIACSVRVEIKFKVEEFNKYYRIKQTTHVHIVGQMRD